MTMSPSAPGTVYRDPAGGLGKRLGLFGVSLSIAAIVSLIVLGLVTTVVLTVLVVLLVAFVAKDSLLAALRWHQPTIQVSSTAYALGSRPVIVFRRKPKQVRDITSCVVECLLVCEERVTYQQGTDTRTDTRIVYESQTSGTGTGTADGLEAEIEMSISANMGAPSFTMPNNEVVWIAKISIVGQRLPRDSHNFVIDVAPVLDVTHRVGVQDT